ncbi:uracil-xanthine permease family protein [Pelovirga terrestris]|uniref:Uracil permease n=1 Tax=Pelovirga terrestris TaxID=2771352 RepID=A0A8J6QU04_9BACT|nr:solute carrier family 23 protein [Pelovirga terrestris]MBD1399815.1 uracil permease [Pelovirga terrestris]
MKKVHAPTDYHFRLQDGLLGAQMLFVAFGALVLVPLLTGLDANVALFTAGVGTLVFQIITRGKVPVFLASSFAFIAPIIYGVGQWGIAGTMCGLLAAGGLYIVLSILVRIFGSGILHRFLPPIVVGPVIMVIGLVLAPVAIHMASGRTGDGSAWLVPETTAYIIAGIALTVTVLVSLLGHGMFRLIPILCGIIAGYGASLLFDLSGLTATLHASFDPGDLPNWTGPALISMQKAIEAPWLAIPNFTMPVWNLEAILFIVPIALAPAIEHFGDVMAIGGITGKDYVRDPGIQNTLLGDGVATSVAALLGGPPNTTYSEVSGAVALTRSFNPAIMTWAAIAAIILAFVGKLGGLLSTIPVPVMGGIMVLLFGAIAVIGIGTLVRAGTDLMQPRNMAIVAIILVFGIGGMTFDLAIVKLGGIGLAGIIGVVLNLILPYSVHD